MDESLKNAELFMLALSIRVGGYGLRVAARGYVQKPALLCRLV